MDTTASEVIDFWFGPEGGPERGRAREVWFRKDPAFDEAIRGRFGEAVAVALAGGLGEWCATPQGALARVLLLDQFTRNIFRDTPRAFAGDERALATADEAIERGFDRELWHHGRWFLYMPFEHAEDVAAQHRSLALFGALAKEMGDDGPLEWARKHAEIVFRFGRYPHRNAILGRASTAEEEAFLLEPGSSF
ncbi:MAG: DUF924 domain-containing protein [Burkholderiales bacterium]|nr:DUF924 domain-containing protein [Burkholderiales bacterium]